jgi:hypothetical protein
MKMSEKLLFINYKSLYIQSFLKESNLEKLTAAFLRNGIKNWIQFKFLRLTRVIYIGHSIYEI